VRIDQLSGDRVALVVDPRFGREHSEVAPEAWRRGVIGRGHQQDRVVEHLFGGEPRGRRRQSCEREFDPILLQGAPEGRGPVDLHRQLQLRVVSTQPRQDLREMMHRHQVGGAQGETSAQRPFGTQLVLQTFRGFEQRPRARVEPLPRFGRSDAPPRPAQERLPGAGLESIETRAHRGLAEEEPTRGRGQAALLHRQDEGFEVAQTHAAIISVYGSSRKYRFHLEVAAPRSCPPVRGHTDRKRELKR